MNYGPLNKVEIITSRHRHFWVLGNQSLRPVPKRKSNKISSLELSHSLLPCVPYATQAQWEAILHGKLHATIKQTENTGTKWFICDCYVMGSALLATLGAAISAKSLLFHGTANFQTRREQDQLPSDITVEEKKKIQFEKIVQFFSPYF